MIKRKETKPDGFPLHPGATGPLSPEYIEEAARRAGQMVRQSNRGGESRREVENMKAFGLYIRASRRRQGLSYSNLAQSLGVEKDLLIFLESGLVSRKEINNATLEGLSRELIEDPSRLHQVISGEKPKT